MQIAKNKNQIRKLDDPESTNLVYYSFGFYYAVQMLNILIYIIFYLIAFLKHAFLLISALFPKFSNYLGKSRKCLKQLTDGFLI